MSNIHRQRTKHNSSKHATQRPSSDAPTYKRARQKANPVPVTDSISYDPSTSILFASFKYTGTDFAADMELIRQDAKMREWWKMTDGYQESLNPGAVSSEMGGVDGTPGWWKEIEEVFYVA